jgi:hypothetical protein
MKRAIELKYTQEYINAGMPAQHMSFESIDIAIEHERSASKLLLSDQEIQNLLCLVADIQKVRHRDRRPARRALHD